MFLFSLFVFVSAASHYFRIWTGQVNIIILDKKYNSVFLFKFALSWHFSVFPFIFALSWHFSVFPFKFALSWHFSVFPFKFALSWHFSVFPFIFALSWHFSVLPVKSHGHLNHPLSREIT